MERFDTTVPIILTGKNTSSCFLKNQLQTPQKIPQNDQNGMISFLKNPTTQEQTKKVPSNDPLPSLW